MNMFSVHTQRQRDNDSNNDNKNYNERKKHRNKIRDQPEEDQQLTAKCEMLHFATFANRFLSIYIDVVGNVCNNLIAIAVCKNTI